MSDSKSIGKRLLSIETFDKEQRAEYEAAMQRLLESKLSTAQRISFTSVAIVVAGLACLTGWLALFSHQLPTLARVGLGIGTLFSIAAVGWLVSVLRSGVFHHRRSPTFMSGLMWCFSVMLMMFFIMLTPSLANRDIGSSLSMLGMGFVVMFGSGLTLIRTCIEQSELNTHERMLELAIRLSDAKEE